MTTILMTDAQLNRALRGAAIEAVTHFCKVQGIEVKDPNIIRVNEAEAMLKVKRPTLNRLAESGQIKRVRVGGVWRYDRESILEYLAKNERAYGCE